MAESNEYLYGDALPYYDKSFDELGVREFALQQVEEEMKRYRPAKNYLEGLPPLDLRSFETPIMRAEFERLANRQPFEPVSMRRYELPAPVAARSTDPAAWAESVKNAAAQCETQRLRLQNLELLLKHGPAAWQMNVVLMGRLLGSIDREHQAIRAQIAALNRTRRDEQLAAGEQMRTLEECWVSLVSKNYELEMVCARLEQELKQRTPAASAPSADAQIPSQTPDVETAQQDVSKNVENVSNPQPE